ncbi:hypothetical protein SESBI_03086 [Sesbania bispinosa]|nr:hypothetical protein SESBI_03086 [Sesbania bispinosa]
MRRCLTQYPLRFSSLAIFFLQTILTKLLSRSLVAVQAVSSSPRAPSCRCLGIASCRLTVRPELRAPLACTCFLPSLRSPRAPLCRYLPRR